MSRKSAIPEIDDIAPGLYYQDEHVNEWVGKDPLFIYRGIYIDGVLNAHQLRRIAEAMDDFGMDEVQRVYRCDEWEAVEQFQERNPDFVTAALMVRAIIERMFVDAPVTLEIERNPYAGCDMIIWAYIEVPRIVDGHQAMLAFYKEWQQIKLRPLNRMISVDLRYAQ